MIKTKVIQKVNLYPHKKGTKEENGAQTVQSTHKDTHNRSPTPQHHKDNASHHNPELDSSPLQTIITNIYQSLFNCDSPDAPFDTDPATNSEQIGQIDT